MAGHRALNLYGDKWKRDTVRGVIVIKASLSSTGKVAVGRVINTAVRRVKGLTIGSIITAASGEGRACSGGPKR